jgi:hypothetical protein
VVAEAVSIQELKRGYRTTWAEYTLRVNALEQLRRKGLPEQTAVLALERAHQAHRIARDLLAEALGVIKLKPLMFRTSHS